jgi:hypothetical protein
MQQRGAAKSFFLLFAIFVPELYHSKTHLSQLHDLPFSELRCSIRKLDGLESGLQSYKMSSDGQYKINRKAVGSDPPRRWS